LGQQYGKKASHCHAKPAEAGYPKLMLCEQQSAGGV
jgi:hypothetical protein